MIPKTFHRVWLGPRPIPPAEYEYGQSWLRLNPGWTDLLWDEGNLPSLENQAEFDDAPNFSQKSDVVRYEMVHRHGGVYIDTDFECLKPIEPLLEGLEAFVVREDSENVSSAIFGAVAGHRLLEAIIAELPDSAANFPNGPSNEATGPLFLTRLLRDRPDLLEGVAVFEPEWFYPYPWGRPDLRHGPFPDAYGVHHWSGSWITPERPSFAGRLGRRMAALRRTSR